MDERAFTDVALIALESFSAGAASVALFAQSQEALTGADFELQIFDAAGNRVSFLIQAKALKLDQPSGGYPALGDNSPAGGRQYARLQASCGPGSLYPASAPMHVFYNGALLRSNNAWPPDGRGIPMPPVGPARDEEARGITIGHTGAVAAAITASPTSYRVSRVAPVCWPWGCFFCYGARSLQALAVRAGTLPG